MKSTIAALPQFEVRTLDASELELVAGGLYQNDASVECTAGTQSVCHIDGTTDSN